jgi:hypothetical protein
MAAMVRDRFAAEVAEAAVVVPAAVAVAAEVVVEAVEAAAVEAAAAAAAEAAAEAAVRVADSRSPTLSHPRSSGCRSIRRSRPHVEGSRMSSRRSSRSTA